jgi:hypothetical protein
MNYKYLHVSKALVEIPVINPDGSVGPAKQVVPVKYGTTYRRPVPKKMSKRERRKLDKLEGITRQASDCLHRLGCANPVRP